MQIDEDVLREVEAALALVPSAINNSFNAGAEEREGGSVRRQEVYSARVAAVRIAAAAALSSLRKAVKDTPND